MYLFSKIIKINSSLCNVILKEWYIHFFLNFEIIDTNKTNWFQNKIVFIFTKITHTTHSNGWPSCRRVSCSHNYEPCLDPFWIFLWVAIRALGFRTTHNYEPYWDWFWIFFCIVIFINSYSILTNCLYVSHVKWPN